MVKNHLIVKRALKQAAIEVLEARIKSATDAMIAAQLSANEEGKSSAGDKYETSRAMAQIERDIHAKQSESAKRELNILQKIEVEVKHDIITAGALVETEKHKYFFLSGLGAINYKNEQIIFLSMNSPLAKIMSGKKESEIVSFNGENISVLKIY